MVLEEIQIDNEITNVSQEVIFFCEQNQVLQEQLEKFEERNKEESEKATQTKIDLKLQVEEATTIKESISNSLKDKLEKLATEIEKQSEEIVKLKRMLEDKDKELKIICEKNQVLQEELDESKKRIKNNLTRPHRL